MSDGTIFASTMREIDLEDNSRNNRESLELEIIKLEGEIKSAEHSRDLAGAEPMGHTPISPEKANEQHKLLVFMKKNLLKAQSDLKSLLNDLT